jgi:hypothetical protein
MVLERFLKWSLTDVLNEDLLSLQQVPTQFESISDWSRVFLPHVLEDFRVTVAKDIRNCNFKKVPYIMESLSSPLHVTVHMDHGCSDSDEEDEEDEDVEENCASDSISSISTKVGMFSSHSCLADGNLPETAKIFFCKVMIFVDEKKQRKKKGLRGKIWVSPEFHEEYRSYPDNNWDLLLLSCCSVPHERIATGLADCMDLSERKRFIPELLNGSYHGPSLLISDTVASDTSHNIAQSNAIRTSVSRVCDRSYPSVQLIHGPPGTGKSKTIIGIIFELLSLNVPVCATAPTNNAVCEIAKRAYREAVSLEFPVYKIVLCGSSDRLKLNKDLEKIHLEGRINRLTLAVRWWCEMHSSGELSTLSRHYDSTLISRVLNNLEIICDECPDAFLSLQRESLVRMITLLKEILQHHSGPHLDLRMTEFMLKVKEASLNDLFLGLFRAVNNRQRLEDVILRESSLLFSTVSHAALLRRKDHLLKFPFIIVDEAGQLVEAATSILLSDSLECLVLVGDHCQLPSTVISKKCKKLGYGESLFSRLIKASYPSTLLNVQYRMHPEISKWPSKAFYQSSITDGENVKHENYKMFWYDKFPPVSVCNADGKEVEEPKSKSKYNLLEVKIVVKFMRDLSRRIEAEKTDDEVSVAIITPYTAQVREINLELSSFQFTRNLKYVCSSVDAFQGQECDFVIFSAVRSQNDLGFVADMRRFNVAITRAKYSLIVIGHYETLRIHYELADFIEYAKKSHIKCSSYKYYDPTSDFIKSSHKSLATQSRLVEDMWNFKNSLFEDCNWAGKISFTNEFKRKIGKLPLKEKEDIFKALHLLAKGRWPKYRHSSLKDFIDDSLTEIIFVRPFGSVYLFWCVDAKVMITSLLFLT